jgi:dihydroxyacetone kinase-like predicted kinase|tara:strand:- start:209 stop:457 length:249 start_codon:yes stop_codon:yes gene_type:complete
MAKLKLSNIVERELYIDSDSFKSLSPKMKDAVKDIYERIQKETGDIIKVFEGAVDKAAEFHNINTKVLYDYFDKELEEQLGE